MDKKKLKELMVPALEGKGVLKAALFGSTARGDATIDSDIDILIELEASKTLLDLCGIKIELEELLKKKVDLVTYGGINPLLKDNILSEQDVFYEKR